MEPAPVLGARFWLHTPKPASLGTKGAPWGEAAGTIRHGKQSLPASSPINPLVGAVYRVALQIFASLHGIMLPFVRK